MCPMGLPDELPAQHPRSTFGHPQVRVRELLRHGVRVEGTVESVLTGRAFVRPRRWMGRVLALRPGSGDRPVRVWAQGSRARRAARGRSTTPTLLLSTVPMLGRAGAWAYAAGPCCGEPGLHGGEPAALEQLDGEP